MGFAMRMKTGDIIKPGSFRSIYVGGKKGGFSFDVQLAYYRGHYLSDVDCLEVCVDGQKMPQEAVTLELNGKEFTTYQFAHAETEFWSQTAAARVNVIRPGGLPAGAHELRLTLMLRVPYMAMGPRAYMPLDCGDTVTMPLDEGGRP